jgi:ribosomal protein S10
MDIKFSLILYSKYSKFSTEILDYINQYSHIFSSNFNLIPVCVDNEDIRKQILDSKKVEVISVPCILIVYNDGGIEKYDDSQAFQWVNEIVLRFSPPKPQEIQQPNIEDIQDDILEEDEEEEKPPTPIPTKKTKPKIVKSATKHKTSIDDLDMDILEDVDDIESRANIKQVESTNALSAKRNDLMSSAAAMQKSRDDFVDTTDNRKKLIK